MLHAYKEIFAEPSFLVLAQQAQHRDTSALRKLSLFLLSIPLLSKSIDIMAAAFIYDNQTSADGYYRSSSPTASLSPTLVDDLHYTERPSLKLSFPCGASNILNSAVLNPAGRSLYSISSSSKRTTMISCRGNVKVASVKWDRHSPQMEFHRKKTKCKEWLKPTGPENEYTTHLPLSSPT